jgi:N-acetylneuraminate epimerase
MAANFSLAVLAAAILTDKLRADNWTDLPPLPAAISGQFAGVSHGALLVVGGSSFEKPPYDGGVKQWLDTIQVLVPHASQWQTFHTSGPIAYGGSITWGDALIMAGGSDGRNNFREVRKVEWIGDKPIETKLPPLPIPLANCEAALIGNRMFVFGGQQSPTAASASNSLFSLDLVNPQSGWQTLDALPGPARILPVFASAGPDLYVFGGAELTPSGRRYLRDGWRWRTAEGRTSREGWRPVPRPPFAMVAAPAVMLSAKSIAVFGGDDGEFALRVEELRDRHPGFSKDVYEFRIDRPEWIRRGTLPLGLVTTTAVRWHDRIVIPGGEDRPGHRSARVLGWLPE